MEEIWANFELFKKESNILSVDNDDDLNANDDNELCKNCKKYTLCSDTLNGTIVCMSCGCVNEHDIIDQTAEWTFNSEDNKKDPSRCGCPVNPLLEKSSMSTMIRSNKYCFMKKLHNQMSMDYVERSRYHVFENISKMAGDVGKLTPAIIEQAKYYYKLLSERKLSRGVIRKGLIACCIIYACKTMNVPRSLKEISKMTEVSIPILNKTMKIFVTLMNDVLQKHDRVNNEYFVFEATECSHLLSRYCNSLNLPDKNDSKLLLRESVRVNNIVKESGLLDCKTPSAIATSIIIYASTNLKLTYFTKIDISKHFNVSIVTINKIVKLIKTHFEENVNV
jgi:transcription initiation factor TFIIB